MHLPILRSVRLLNVSLYPKTLQKSFRPGLNLILGGNGLGKSTLVNTVLFGILGPWAYPYLDPRSGKVVAISLLPKDYYEGRVKPEDLIKSEVEVEFELSNHTIKATRRLQDGALTILSIRDQSGHEASSLAPKPKESTADAYERIIRQLSKVTIAEFSFLVQVLLFFSEERTTLMWEPSAQNRVLRLLFLQSGLDAEIARVMKEITDYDTRARHQSEKRKDILSFIQQTQELRQQYATQQSETNSSESLVDYEQQAADLAAELEISNSSIQDQTAKVVGTKSLLDACIAEGDEVEAQIRALEQQFYDAMYGSVSDSYLVYLHSLAKDATCPMCNTTGEAVRELGKSLHSLGNCIMCRSPLPQAPEPTPHSQEKINELRTAEAILQQRESALRAQYQSEKLLLDECVELRSRQQRNFEDMNLKITIAKSLLDPSTKTADDPIVEGQLKQVEKLTQTINANYEKSKLSKEQLRALNKKVAAFLGSVNAQLSPIFSEFASSFLGTPCELVVHTTKGNRPVVAMYPKFDGSERPKANNVSESQQFFIDQAFRMALLTWFQSKKGSHATLIVETPEGSLDVAYEKNVARMYKNFANTGQTVILTSNLNSSKFLEAALGEMNSAERKARVLDLTLVGKMSDVQLQLDNENAFRAIRKTLKLEQ